MSDLVLGLAAVARECAGASEGGDGGRRKERQGLAELSRRGWSKHHRRRRRPRAAPSHAAALDIARLMSDPSQSFFRSSAHPPASAAPALRSRASASSSVPPSSARRRRRPRAVARCCTDGRRHRPHSPSTAADAQQAPTARRCPLPATPRACHPVHTPSRVILANSCANLRATASTLNARPLHSLDPSRSPRFTRSSAPFA